RRPCRTEASARYRGGARGRLRPDLPVRSAGLGEASAAARRGRAARLGRSGLRSCPVPDQRLLAEEQRPLRLAQDPPADLRRGDLVHANDARDPSGTGADRHANLGSGTIDPDALRAMIRAPGAPVVCETLGTLADMRADLEFVRAALR